MRASVRGGVLRHVAAGEDDLVRHQGGGLREAPGLAVEHGGDDHGGVPERHADRGGQGIRVQHDRAVRVEHPLRPAGRAGGVARAVGGGLLDLRPVDVRGGRGQEVLVVPHARQRRLDLGQGAVRHHHPRGHLRQTRGDDLGVAQQGLVHEHRGAPAVREDVDEVFGCEAEIHLDHRRADAGDRPVELVVSPTVPVDDAHAVAGADAEAGHGVRGAADPFVGLGVRVAVPPPSGVR